MFSNIGSKIKAVAYIACWMGIIASLISGIMFFSAGSNAQDGGAFIGYGVAVMVGGSLLSWVGSFFAYGFGEWIENSRKTNELLERISDELLKRDNAHDRDDLSILTGRKDSLAAPHKALSLSNESIKVNESQLFRCPKCNAFQRTDRKSCFKCGLVFEHKEEA